MRKFSLLAEAKLSNQVMNAFPICCSVFLFFAFGLVNATYLIYV